MPKARVSGFGMFVPEKVYDNAYFESIVETNDEWITRRTGIKERHIAEPEDYTSELATRAAQNALDNSGVSAEDIDLIILSTVTPDYFTPNTACIVQRNIGAVNAAAFDFNAACSSFITGMVTAAQFIENGVYKNILIVCADVLSKATDYKDRATCILFGDSAGAAVLSASEDGGGLISFELGADGAGCMNITQLAYREDAEETEKRVDHRKETVWMNGQAVMKFAVKAMADSSNRILEKAGLSYDDIKLIVPHQANYRIVDSAIKRMGVEREKVFLHLERHGNTSSSCIPVALTEASQQGLIERGDKVLIVGFGGGLTWGAAIFEY